MERMGEKDKQHYERKNRMNRLLLSIGLIAWISVIALGSNNVCEISTLVQNGNSSFYIGVYIENTDSLGGFQIPIHTDYEQNMVTCDSISFTGGRCEGFEFLDSKIDNEKQVVYITGIHVLIGEENHQPLAPGEGEVARIYFTYEGDPTGAPLIIRQDSYQMGANKLEYRFWKPDGEEVNFRFEAAPMKILE